MVGDQLQEPVSYIDAPSSDRDDVAIAGPLTYNYMSATAGGNLLAYDFQAAPNGTFAPYLNAWQPGVVGKAAGVDFLSEQLNVWRASIELRTLPVTGTSRFRYASLDLMGVRSDVNVFRLTYGQLAYARDITLHILTVRTAEI